MSTPIQNIRDEIVAKRRARIEQTGFAEGVNLPETRVAGVISS